MGKTEKQLAAAASPPTTVPEVVDRAVIDVAGQAVEVQAAVAPTQMRYPWRSTLRGMVQFLFGALTLLPLIVSGVYHDADQIPYAVAQALAFQAALSRVMGIPQVEAFLRASGVLSWLSAAPAPDDHVIDPPPAALLQRAVNLIAAQVPMVDEVNQQANRAARRNQGGFRVEKAFPRD